MDDNEIHIALWQSEQEHTRIRWTVVTFFLSVSFVIFGFSLQAQKPPIPIFVVHIAALAIYWFGYLLFLRFNMFTKFMREYLAEMENSGRVTIDIQSKANKVMISNKSRFLSAKALLLEFGIVYTIAVIILSLI